MSDTQQELKVNDFGEIYVKWRLDQKIHPCQYAYLLLIIAKKQYGLKPSLHTISNSIGQFLFKRGDIRDFYNKPDEPVNFPEDDSNRQLTL